MDTTSEEPQPSWQTLISNFKALYAQFDAQCLQNLPSLYADNVVFKDPIHELQGLNQLNHYFSGFCTSDTHCTFEFTNELITAEQAFFQWKMHYSNPKLANGKSLALNGGTLIKFDNLITYHEDFYDMGAMIYQHVPLLGRAINYINQRLAG